MAAVSIRSVPSKCLRNNRKAKLRGGRSEDPSLALVPSKEPPSAGTRRLKVNLRKVGRFVIKCLGDLARDSTMMGFWP
jgi:hypothetical protein